MKRLSVEICVSEESLDLITDNTIVVLMLKTHLEAQLDHSQYLVLVLVNTGVLVIWLVVLLIQPSLVEVEPVIKLDHLVLVGADSVLVDLLK
jgi:hypothetical protein